MSEPMTNPPPVAPVEKHYALLQNGTVIRHLSRCEYNADIYRSPMIANCFWHSDGRCFVEHPSNGPEPWSHADIIATISPADMQAVASGELERLRAANEKMKSALAFYADDGPTPNVDGPWNATSWDFGDLARCTLADVTALEGGTV